MAGDGLHTSVGTWSQGHLDHVTDWETDALGGTLVCRGQSRGLARGFTPAFRDKC